MSYPGRKAPHWSETADRQPDDRLDVVMTVSHDRESVTLSGGSLLAIMSPAQARRLGLALEAAAEEIEPTPIPKGLWHKPDGADL